MHRGLTGRYVTSTTAGETTRAFVPRPLPPEPPVDLTGPRHRLLERATLALGRLDSITSLLPDCQLFEFAVQVVSDEIRVGIPDDGQRHHNRFQT